MIAIPQCIWCNFTDGKDYCRWIVYDDKQPEEEEGYKRKIYSDAFGFKKLAFFNYHRDPSLDNIEYYHNISEEGLNEQTNGIKELFKQQTFEDYTDHEKDWIKSKYANHRPNCSLMLYEECLEEKKLAILSRLVHMTPHPKDENGNIIPFVRDSKGIVQEWPKDENGKEVDVYELDKWLE